MSQVLARRGRALTPVETHELLVDRLGDEVIVDSLVEYATHTITVAASGWHATVERCRDERLLAFDLFDCLFGVDAREGGFDVVAVLYSTSTGNRLVLRARCEGGREAPTIGTVTDLYRGADWHERETWDMFGIDFAGHPGLEPRLLTVENFEGWPLRKDFPLASRVAKPWPGVKEPAELDEHGNVIEREPRIGDAPGPTELDKAMAEQAKLANPPAQQPVTAEGENVEEGAESAELAGDSGAVLAGETEREAEVAEQAADDVATEVADEQTSDAAEAAKEQAERRRREQVEARARKAAERADADEADEATGGENTTTGGENAADDAQPRDDDEREGEA